MTKKEYLHNYYLAHKEKLNASSKIYYEEHKNEISKWQYNYTKEYRKTPMGRAILLVNNYKKHDKNHNRGECTLTPEWIVENIFSKPCVHCGETDWRKIGCNRLDNSLPHTTDNVEPCCKKCNDYLGNPPKKVYQYTLDGVFIKIWQSTKECHRNGYNGSAVSACCRNVWQKRGNIYKGYIWSYEPL